MVPSSVVFLFCRQPPPANSLPIHIVVSVVCALALWAAGCLWDLEFLTDENDRRVAAFGRAAGLAGMAAAILAWVHQQRHPTAGALPLPALASYPTVAAMVDIVRAELATVTSSVTARRRPLPRTLVIGANGRVGGGATWFAQQVGLAVTEWDLAEVCSSVLTVDSVVTTGECECVLSSPCLCRFIDCVQCVNSDKEWRAVSRAVAARHCRQLYLLVGAAGPVSDAGHAGATSSDLVGADRYLVRHH